MLAPVSLQITAMSTSPEYMGYNLEAFVGAFTPICIIATALRFYARSLVIKRYDAGDWLIIAALFGQLVAGGLAVGKFFLHEVSPSSG